MARTCAGTSQVARAWQPIPCRPSLTARPERYSLLSQKKWGLHGMEGLAAKEKEGGEGGGGGAREGKREERSLLASQPDPFNSFWGGTGFFG